MSMVWHTELALMGHGFMMSHFGRREWLQKFATNKSLNEPHPLKFSFAMHVNFHPTYLDQPILSSTHLLFAGRCPSLPPHHKSRLTLSIYKSPSHNDHSSTTTNNLDERWIHPSISTPPFPLPHTPFRTAPPNSRATFDQASSLRVSSLTYSPQVFA
jgi:hypothetical protein